MPVTEPLNFDQPSNELSSIADIERRKLLPKNDYKSILQAFLPILLKLPYVVRYAQMHSLLI